MKTVIVGGGKGCRAIIKLAIGAFLKEVSLEILCVMDTDNEAPGMQFARQKGIKTTCSLDEALSIPNIKLIIELTGLDPVLENIYKIIPRGIKVFDHTFARIFWDLANAQRDQAYQLKEITELEKKIERERIFLQSLFDQFPELAAVTDKNKRIVKINASFGVFTGLSPEEAVGKFCIELFTNTELQPHKQQAKKMLDDVSKSGQPRTLIWQSPAPYEAFWEVTHTPIIKESKFTGDILSTWHRITDQVLLQRKFESAELKFQSFIDSAHDWISVKDLDGRYLIVNKIIAHSLHLEPEDFIGKKPEDMLPPELWKMIRQHDREVIHDDCYHTYSETILIDGRNRHFQTARFPLKDYKNSTIGVCTIMRDVTSEKNLSKQLVQAEKLAAIGKLAAGVAHEINNPLTGVLAYAEDMADEMSNDDPHKEDLKVIIRETLRCRDIVRNLLDFSRQESPKLEKIDPNQIVDRSLLLIVKLPQFRNIEIKEKLKAKIPTIQGDPSQLQQVLLNFMLNSAEAMQGKGSITITTKYDRKHDKCIIAVEDTGPGIPENLRDKIFEPFFSTKGTNGLGLAVGWGIIERHHGTIEVDKTKSGGALFRIILPVYDENDDS